jgi:hypothetical protein
MTPRYDERPSIRSAAMVGALFAALVLGLFLPELAAGTFRASDLLLVPVTALVALPFAVLPLSRRRSHSITLTDDDLVVGRARVPARGLRVLEGPPPPGTPLLGGAQNTPLGWEEVTVQGADGRRWRIATQQPEEFTAALVALRRAV